MPAAPKPGKKKKAKRKKKPSLKSLKTKADIAFSKFIRDRDAKNLKGLCCTCGQPGNQAGHFVKRSYMALRYDPLNVHLQCFRCNHHLSGNESEYAKFIINKYGIEIFMLLMERKKEIFKLTRDYLEQVIFAYGVR